MGAFFLSCADGGNASLHRLILPFASERQNRGKRNISGQTQDKKERKTPYAEPLPALRDERRLRLWLVGILVASLILSVWFAIRVPLNGNPDETSHRDYIRLLIQERGLVTFKPVPFDTVFGPDTPTPWETHQPPLYYLLALPVHAASGGSVFAVRLVAAILQLLTILVVFRAARDLFPRRGELAVGAALFVALLPAQAQLAAAISNDSLTTLLSALLLWRVALVVVRGQTVREAALVALILGAGVLTKLSVLQLLPAVLLAYIFAVRAGHLTTRDALVRCGIAVGVGLFLSAPWLLRNQLLYGDPLALRIYPLTGPNFTPEQIMQLSGWGWSDYIRNVGVRSFATFWYLLPPNLPLKQFTGPPLPLVAALALALAGLFGVYRLFRDARPAPDTARIVAWCFAATALLLPFYARFVLTVFQAQGRYFLPALLPIALLTVLGWASLAPPNRAGGGVGIMGAVLLLLCLLQIATF